MYRNTSDTRVLPSLQGAAYRMEQAVLEIQRKKTATTLEFAGAAAVQWKP